MASTSPGAQTGGPAGLILRLAAKRPHPEARPDEQPWRDVLTPGLNLSPAFPDLHPVAVLRPGGLCPDTVALPSPILTGFPHFQCCFETLPAPSGTGGLKELPQESPETPRWQACSQAEWLTDGKCGAQNESGSGCYKSFLHWADDELATPMWEAHGYAIEG